MKKCFNIRILMLSLFLASGFSLAPLTGTVQAQVTPDVIISETSSAAGITLTANQVYQINPDVTYTLTGAITGNYTLTKTGTGTMQLNGWGNSNVVVNEGLLFISGQSNLARFNTSLTINSGATVRCITKDAFGYDKAAGGNQNIYIYGGTLDKDFTSTDNNETLGYVNIYLKGGTLKATTGFYDLLRPESKIFSEAADGATAENPTASFITSSLRIRTGHMSATSGPTFTTAENSLLTVSGGITDGKAGDLNLEKVGTGTLQLTSSGNTYAGLTFIKEGTLKLSGASKPGTGAVTVSDGAMLEMSTTASVGNALTFTGDGVNAKGALLFTSAGTYSGAAVLGGDASIGVAEGVKGVISGNITAAAGQTLSVTGGGILEFTAHQSNFAGNLEINAGAVRLSLACSQEGTFTAGSTITVNTGAKLELNAADALGYGTGNPDMIYVNGGVVTSTAAAHYSVGNFTLTNGSILDDGFTNTDKLSYYLLDGNITVNAGTSYITTTGKFSYRGLNSSAQTSFDVKEGGNLIVSAPLAANSTGGVLHKTGTGTLTLNAATVGSGTLSLEAGTLLIKAGNGGHRWNGTINVAAGAVIQTEKDGIGYNTTSGRTTINLEGTLNATGENETLGVVTINYKGGNSTGSRYDILYSDVQLNSVALAGATAENPTVSTVGNALKIRNNVAGTDALTFTTAENTVLKLNGQIFSEFQTGSAGFHKAGAGELVISNASNALGRIDVYVDAGTLKIENDALKTVKSLSMGRGTHLALDAASVTLPALDFAGSIDVNVTSSGSDFKTVTGNVAFSDGATFNLLSDTDLNYLDFYDSGITLMGSNSEFENIDAVSFDISGLNMNIPVGYGFHAEQSLRDGMYYLTAAMNAPEPASWLLLAFGGVFFGLHLARKRRRSL